MPTLKTQAPRSTGPVEAFVRATRCVLCAVHVCVLTGPGPLVLCYAHVVRDLFDAEMRSRRADIEQARARVRLYFIFVFERHKVKRNRNKSRYYYMKTILRATPPPTRQTRLHARNRGRVSEKQCATTTNGRI